jgi:hypothetical protein
MRCFPQSASVLIGVRWCANARRLLDPSDHEFASVIDLSDATPPRNMVQRLCLARGRLRKSRFCLKAGNVAVEFRFSTIDDFGGGTLP